MVDWDSMLNILIEQIEFNSFILNFSRIVWRPFLSNFLLFILFFFFQSFFLAVFLKCFCATSCAKFLEPGGGDAFKQEVSDNFVSEGATGHLADSNVTETNISCHWRHNGGQTRLGFADHLGGNTTWLVANDVYLVFKFKMKTLSHICIKHFGRTVDCADPGNWSNG